MAALYHNSNFDITPYLIDPSKPYCLVVFKPNMYYLLTLNNQAPGHGVGGLTIDAGDFHTFILKPGYYLNSHCAGGETNGSRIPINIGNAQHSSYIGGSTDTSTWSVYPAIPGDVTNRRGYNGIGQHYDINGRLSGAQSPSLARTNGYARIFTNNDPYILSYNIRYSGINTMRYSNNFLLGQDKVNSAWSSISSLSVPDVNSTTKSSAQSTYDSAQTHYNVATSAGSSFTNYDNIVSKYNSIKTAYDNIVARDARLTKKADKTELNTANTNARVEYTTLYTKGAEDYTALKTALAAANKRMKL